ncbi:hypothetical protein F8C76_01880 [Flagellimonas olearia]|uniref:Uncharacterized protein n=1 Tax=Flagellimonas olearia TaxID=552546 RepID=A0A6I1E2V1_9FLAO|nr:hypothetical protein [Allomuricauda olearia]KAB7530281.1 hypothetical protein F8C76_01880 [Allomuricauda olearia]
MELEIMAIGAVIIALCAVPFIATVRIRKKEEKVLLDGLNTIAKSHHSDVGIHDFGVDFAIGLSSAKNHLFFYKEQKKGKTITECIPINLIQSCMIHKVKRRVKTKKGTEEVLQRLELVFNLHGSEPSTCSLPFYDSEQHYQPSGELPLIEMWELTIKEARRFYPT